MAQFSLKKKCAGPCSARTALKKKRCSLLTWLRRLGRRVLNLYRPYKDGPGEINVYIALGGMVIEPGDPATRRPVMTTACSAFHSIRQRAYRFWCISEYTIGSYALALQRYPCVDQRSMEPLSDGAFM